MNGGVSTVQTLLHYSNFVPTHRDPIKGPVSGLSQRSRSMPRGDGSVFIVCDVMSVWLGVRIRGGCLVKFLMRTLSFMFEWVSECSNSQWQASLNYITRTPWNDFLPFISLFWALLTDSLRPSSVCVLSK